MVLSTGAFKDAVNGRERKTDGVRYHTGPFTVVGGPVNLPDGSIGTSELAAGAAQAQLGSYMQMPTWSTTATGSWVGTPLIVNIVAGAGLLRFDWAIHLRHSVANALVMVGIGWDGAAQMGCDWCSLPTAGFPDTSKGVYYQQLVGTHQVQVFVLNNTAGTLTIDTGLYSRLYVTEQKA